MKNLPILFVILFSNSFLFSMENESKNMVICHRDVNGQSWKLDKEIQFNTEKENISEIIKHKNALRSVCFDPTGTKIIAFPRHADRYMCMWDRDGNKLEDLSFGASTQSSEKIEWFAKLSSSGNSHSFPFYAEDDAKLLEKEFSRICWNEQQTYIVPYFRVHGDYNVYAWSPEEQKVLFTLKHAGIIYSIDFNPQGIEIITASADGMVRLWNKKDGKELLCITYSTRVTSANFNSTGTEMVVATDDGKIQVLVKETLQ